MHAVRIAASVMLVGALAMVLAWPVLTADRSQRFSVEQSDADVVEPRFLSELPDIIQTQEARVAGGERNGKRWGLFVSTGPERWCWGLRVFPGPEQQWAACGQLDSTGGGGSTFTPAISSHGLGRGVLVAALPADVSEITLRATGNATITGHLVRPPGEMGISATMLVVFLPPNTDVVEASASGQTGEVGGLVDLVDAY